MEGNVELVLNQERISAAPGAIMLVPENTPHGFSNPGAKRAKLPDYVLSCDSREQYFEELAELTKNGRQPNQEELLEANASL